MSGLKALFNFYLNSSVHVALSAASLTWVSYLNYGIPASKAVLFFVFFATIVGYNFVKFFGLAKFHHRSLSRGLKSIQLLTVCAIVFGGYFAFQLKWASLLYFFGFGMVTFLYASPFIPVKTTVYYQQNLRNLSGIKIYVIALVWMGVTVFVPLVTAPVALEFAVFWACLQRFVFVLALMLPFEMRDMQYDSLKLATIPQKIGIKNTKIMGIFLMALFWLTTMVMPLAMPIATGIQMVIGLLVVCSVLYAKQNQSKYYSSFWVEGIPVLWLLLMLVFG
ncbi:hypothetical protein ACFSQP_08440 [Bizionia sediminis]|uniref:Prenyltransferase n=1 Tax=Bizionia sediminis TaxID=1737064 RepID=A0ABW5KSH8_9FLAO